MKRRRMIPPDPQTNDAGSPQPGEPVFILVGKLRSPHGVQGEILMELHTDFPERIRSGRVLYAGDQHQKLQILRSRQHNDGKLLQLVGYETRDAVAELTNLMVYARVDELPRLPKGEYYHHELLGLQVRDEAGNLLGVLTEILITGSNDVYVVTAEDGQETLLPALESVILEVDVAQRSMKVRPLEWD